MTRLSTRFESCGGGSGTVKCEVGGKLVVQLNEGSFFGTATKLSDFPAALHCRNEYRV
jgi:hypothetical protein